MQSDLSPLATTLPITQNASGGGNLVTHNPSVARVSEGFSPSPTTHYDTFGYDAKQYDEKAFETQKDFFRFLNIGQTIFLKPRRSTKFSLGTFLQAINEVADVIWKKCEHLFCV